MEFFLQAVEEQSRDAVSRSRCFPELLRSYSCVIRTKRLPPIGGQLVELIFMRPVLNAKTAREFLKVTYPAAQKAISSLEGIGILTEVTGRKRNKAYAAEEILKALEEETPPTQPLGFNRKQQPHL